MKKRADAMLQALSDVVTDRSQITILAAENWVEFFDDIENTSFNDLVELSKIKIKQKLADPAFAKKMEPILAKERKVLATLYLEEKSKLTSVEKDSIVNNFNRAIADKNLAKARTLQRELAERIADHTVPSDYINKLEVPRSKDFAEILNDREVYRFLFRATTEYEALDNFLELKKIDPDNGRINYNIIALQLFAWQSGGDTVVSKTLLKDIGKLSSQGIDSSLQKRMLINYHILQSENQMERFNYAAKDSSLDIIHELYSSVKINDDEIYSLAKFYNYYSHSEWALEIIEPRINKLDVSENLVFYYVNLQFFYAANYDEDNFFKACNNTINLNSKRFCRFFLPVNRGGAGMQLLEYETIRNLYCEKCR